MAEQKTKPTKISVTDFLDAIPDPDRRKDCKKLAAFMKKVTGARPVMWGPSIVGFGSYHYAYDSGHEGDACLTGFANRKELTIYIMSGFAGKEALLAKLGKHKGSKACLYVKRLEDIDLGVLETLIKRSIREIQDRVDKRAR